MPPFVSADTLRATTFVRHVEIHDSLVSTNTRAVELARETEIELPALVAARIQTAGRGRGTHKWWSAEGALTFSLIIDPATHSLTTANWPQLSLTTAVALCDTLQPYLPPTPQRAGSSPTPTGPQCSIKWPNDVLLDNRKIAGILLESPGGAAPAKDRLIIGIGVNVNNSWPSAPPDIAHRGIALCDVTDRQHDLQDLLILLLRSTAARIAELSSANTRLVTAWQRLNQLQGQIVAIQQNDKTIAGPCVEIAADGALVIDTNEGRKRFFSGSPQTSPSGDFRG